MNTIPPDARRTDDRVPTAGANGVGAMSAVSVPAAPAAGRTRWWVWVIVVVAVVGLGALLAWRIQSVRAASATSTSAHHGGGKLPVVVATARTGNLPIYLYGLGTVTPLKTVNVLSRVDGAITQVNYTEGQHVKAGDFLLQIDPRPYQAALDQAKGQLAKDQAAKGIAAWNVKQDTQAMETKAIAQQQLQTDQAALATATGAIEVDQANIDAAQVNLNYCHITSPIDGQIGLRQVDLGNIVHAAGTTSLAVITQRHPITVVFTLEEGDLERLEQRMATGQPVPVDAFNQNLTSKLGSGTLLAVDNVIDPATLTVKIKAQFPNANNALFPSQAVNARLLVDTVRGAVLVPAAAIQNSPTGSKFVYVVEGAAHTVKMRPVTVGADLSAVGGEASTTAVTSGLAAGEVVVTDGVDKLVDGTAVIPRPAEERAGTTRPSTRPTAGVGPVDETGVAGPAMDVPDVAGRPGARGGATQPAAHHHHAAQ